MEEKEKMMSRCLCTSSTLEKLKPFEKPQRYPFIYHPNIVVKYKTPFETDIHRTNTKLEGLNLKPSRHGSPIN